MMKTVIPRLDRGIQIIVETVIKPEFSMAKYPGSKALDTQKNTLYFLSWRYISIFSFSLKIKFTVFALHTNINFSTEQLNRADPKHTDY